MGGESPAAPHMKSAPRTGALFALLSDTGVALMHADVSRDVGDIVGRQSGDRRHIAKLPVMSPRPVTDGELKGHVAVV